MMDSAKLMSPAPAAQGAIGLALACLVIGAWLCLHVATVFLWSWSDSAWLLAMPAALLSCWLFVGLFIVAHDCMHGSLMPGWPRLNRRIGQLCLFLYAGFDFDRVLAKHRDHHRYSGTSGDPDFQDAEPQTFWRWYGKFFAEYFNWRQMAVIALVTAVYVALLGAPLVNVLAFWAAPSLASSLQLFTFGTYLPHRRGEPAFADCHNARTSELPAWLSLITCFHFGYHHEHHLTPAVPWWRLPAAHRARDGSKGPSAAGAA